MSDSQELIKGLEGLAGELGDTAPDSHIRGVLSDTLHELRWVKHMPKPSRRLADRHPVVKLDKLPGNAGVGCQGVPGAYSHAAAEALFSQPALHFYEEFSDVADAVAGGEVEFGVLPVENSSAGQVAQVLDLVSQRGFYIARSVDIRVEHCLGIHPESDPAKIRAALSHPQALAQCAHFLEARGLAPQRFSNTAAAAAEVSRAPGVLACVCSERGAALYGLRVLERGIEDHKENYTRFLCLGRRNVLLPRADTIAIALSMPNEPGALGRLLTRFSACNLDLSRLISMPIASRDFSVLFHLDFRGSILDPQVAALLGAMYDEFPFFRFLGNFSRGSDGKSAV